MFWKKKREVEESPQALNSDEGEGKRCPWCGQPSGYGYPCSVCTRNFDDGLLLMQQVRGPMLAQGRSLEEVADMAAKWVFDERHVLMEAVKRHTVNFNRTAEEGKSNES